jgi:hypothetical protein
MTVPHSYNAKRTKQKGYQLVPKEPTLKMLKALAGEPLILAASDRDELLRRWDEALRASPVR